ncbi:hypothetical protein ABVK25_012273 [Lepraria finkii]|uniref:Uncharacterized protein n=1 Tax=Lepraria finkii TaxID=1340010 RepID=A0ABR4AFP2_9LECA
MHNALFPLTTLLLSTLTPAALACNTITGIKFTNYGFPDASGTPAYKCNGNKVIPTVKATTPSSVTAPITTPYAAAAASPSKSFLQECELIYIPLLKNTSACRTTAPAASTSKSTCTPSSRTRTSARRSASGTSGISIMAAPHSTRSSETRPSNLQVDNRVLFENGKCYNQVSQGRIYTGSDGHVSCPKKRDAQVEAGNDTVGRR